MTVRRGRRGRRARRSALLGALAALLLSACQSAPPLRTKTPLPPVAAQRVPPPPADVMDVPDAVPRIEPRSRYGNPPFYEVFGKRYYVLPSCLGYDERGVASWYGPGFYEDRTSTHEPYDMYAMTAANKTLPLPCYVRVTNLRNGRSVIVRVNDRGPFVANRIIDLSYTAAAKLGMLAKGTAFVEVRDVDPAAPTAPAAAAGPTFADAAPQAAPQAAAKSQASAAPAIPAALFVQVGAFAAPANADRLLRKLRGDGYADAFVRADTIGGRKLYRVRIGPVGGVDDYDRTVNALARIGLKDAHLALN